MNHEQLALDLISKRGMHREYAFLLKWDGSKIPRGATLGGIPIAWTQHGRVIVGDGADVGEYTRLEEYGGAYGNSHCLLITTDLGEATDTTGRRIEPLRLSHNAEITGRQKRSF